jgi:integrase
MSRRGQVGKIEVSGKWYVVRFWKYPPGRNRIHASVKLSPTDPKAFGYLTKGERRIRANEVVVASGVNDQKQFVVDNSGATFREQAEWFLNHAVNRKRHPVKPQTISGWRYIVNNWLNPNIGELPLASVNNGVLKTLVVKMHERKLSAQTMTTYVNLVKLIVASAVDGNGDELYPRKWNNDFIDLPVIENQKQPTFTAEIMSQIVQRASGQDQVLYALLAGTGMRVGEAFGLEIKHVSSDCRTITIGQAAWGKIIQTPKTKSAYRKIDICTPLAEMLRSYIGDRTSGLLFANASGKPLSQTNVVRRSLHPILKELGVEKTGFHSMRRFRATWLRKQRAPEDLIRHWLGHAKSSITDSYSKVADDIEYRHEVAEKIGCGFVLDSKVPKVPRNTAEKEVEIAA